MESVKKICFNKDNIYTEIYNEDDTLVISIKNELVEFKEKYKMPQLINLNKWFSLFDSINEILIDIQNLVESNKIEISKENEKFNLILKVSKIESKYVIISLKEKTLNKDELLNSLIVSISEIKNKLDKSSSINSPIENNQILEKINNLENGMKILKTIIENKFTEYELRMNFMEEKFIKLKISNEEKINSYQELYDKKLKDLEQIIKNKNENLKQTEEQTKILKEKELKIKNELSIQININNLIIQSNEEWDFIYKNISKEKKISNQLLYKSKLDGDECSIFHKKCDNIPNTLVIIKIKSGLKLGGFTSQIWENSPYTWKYDDKSFLFCLNNFKVFKCVDNKKAILSYSFLGPTFGYGYDLYVPDKFLKYSCKDFMQKNGSYFNKKEDYTLTNGEKNFQIEEVEVYKIIFCE